MRAIATDSRPSRRLILDIVLVAVLLLASQLEIWWSAFPVRADAATAPLWAAALFEAALVVPLLVRRRYPMAAVAAIMAALVVQYAVISPAETLTSLVALVVALQGGVVLARSRRRAWVVAALGIAGSVALVPAIGQDALFVTVVFACALASGAGLRERQEHLQLLRAQAAQLKLEQQARAQAAIVEERIRIARELHDLVAHHVSVMVLQSGAARHQLGRDTERATESLLAVERLGREAVDGMRLLLGILRSGESHIGALEGRLGISRIEDLAADVRALGLRVDVRVDDAEVGDLPNSLDISAYRIVQEALTNALRHADASRVEVVVRRSPRQIEIEVADDGASSSALEPPSGDGNGILGMRERAALFGGSLYAGPRGAGQGFVVHAVLPLAGVAS